MASVNISNVAKSYGDTQVLFDINIDVTDGEFVVISVFIEDTCGCCFVRACYPAIGFGNVWTFKKSL